MHPGKLLRRIIEETDGLTQEKLAAQIGVTFVSINTLVNERRSLSAEMAVRLAKRFDMDPMSWMNLQTHLDLWRAQRALNDNTEARS